MGEEAGGGGDGGWGRGELDGVSMSVFLLQVAYYNLIMETWRHYYDTLLSLIDMYIGGILIHAYYILNIAHL